MTTKVTVDAHAGWPVAVSEYLRDAAGTGVRRSRVIVAPNTVQDFHVWDGKDLMIHEVQPGEIDP